MPFGSLSFVLPALQIPPKSQAKKLFFPAETWHNLQFRLSTDLNLFYRV